MRRCDRHVWLRARSGAGARSVARERTLVRTVRRTRVGRARLERRRAFFRQGLSLTMDNSSRARSLCHKLDAVKHLTEAVKYHPTMLKRIWRSATPFVGRGERAGGHDAPSGGRPDQSAIDAGTPGRGHRAGRAWPRSRGARWQMAENFRQYEHRQPCRQPWPNDVPVLLAESPVQPEAAVSRQ